MIAIHCQHCGHLGEVHVAVGSVSVGCPSCGQLVSVGLRDSRSHDDASSGIADCVSPAAGGGPCRDNDKKWISVGGLAEKLAVSFADEVGRDMSDRSRLPWLWDTMTDADVNAVTREWIVLHLFVRSVAFCNHSKDRKTVEALLDHFCSRALHHLTERGLFHSDGEVDSFLHQRYEQYYEAMRRSEDPSFQLMRLAERFLIHCGGLNCVSLGAATIVFTHLLVAGKVLITDLERDLVFMR